MPGIVVNSSSETPHQQAGKNKARKKRFASRLAYPAIIVFLLALSAFFFWQYQDLKANPEKIAEQQTAQLVQEVGQLIKLPDVEVPTIATIEDASKLEDQPFFDQAVNGDKILMYTEAKKAIIYRPSEKQIINVGPIAINADAAQQE